MNQEKFEQMKTELEIFKKREEWYTSEKKLHQKQMGFLIGACVMIYILVTGAMIYFHAYPMIFL